MKTKIFCLLFALVLTVAALASCDLTGGGNKDPNKKYDWDETKLIFQMNKHSQGGELSSGCERYYAGEGSKSDPIDSLIDDRNARSLKTAKVDVEYSYLEDNVEANGWGKNITTIVTQALTGGASAPDMYCNFAYDMVGAAIKGAFANLYSTEYDSNGNGKNENYFRFTEDDYNPVYDSPEDYFDSSIGEGYFIRYMDSLSLSPGEKAYCLASDYCTDLVRSFLVVPVNINLLTTIEGNKLDDKDGENSMVVDKTGDGKYDLEDFYRMVWEDEDWTYDMVAAISAKVAQNISSDFDADGAASHLGDILGFAAGSSSGLTASGLLYTTDITIIDRDSLSFRSENPDLSTFATKLSQLFANNKNNGVTYVTDKQASEKGLGTDILAIRSEFSAGRILFGGVVAVGSLEDDKYQDMKKDGGFGIAPVPLYQKSTSVNPYKTLVHNLARIVSISVTAKDTFEMCTAFLNEQSTRSSDILDEYYNVYLRQVVSGEAAQWNVDMLNYIRNHVNDCFDKTFEDVIKSYDTSNRNLAWHDYLKENNYAASELSSIYVQQTSNKGDAFKKVKEAWNKLP